MERNISYLDGAMMTDAQGLCLPDSTEGAYLSSVSVDSPLCESSGLSRHLLEVIPPAPALARPRLRIRPESQQIPVYPAEECLDEL